MVQVKSFCDFVRRSYATIDIIINNAAQSIKRDVSYYKHLVAIEEEPLSAEARLQIDEAFEDEQRCRDLGSSSSAADGLALCAQNPQLARSVVTALNARKLVAPQQPASLLFPEKLLDVNEQQIDLNSGNSWVQQIEQIDFMEFAETQLINCWSPFLICKLLKPLLERSPHAKRYIINVSSMEGVFYQQRKRSAHVQNNISKAGLNMLTRTCASHFLRSGIYMVSVDTGHVTNMFPQNFARNRFEDLTPLDELDGAMRILDPIYGGENG